MCHRNHQSEGLVTEEEDCRGLGWIRGREQPRQTGVRLHRALGNMLKSMPFVCEGNGELLVILSRGKA